MYIIKINKIVSLLLVVTILIISTIVPVFSVSDTLSVDSEVIEEFEKFENGLANNDPDAYILANKKKFSIEESFRTDRVLVVLKHSYSKINKVNKASDFHSDLFSEVEDLSYIDNYSTEDEYAYRKVNEDEFHQILSLKLKTPSKENVIEAVEYLNTLDEVLSAEPDYIYQCKEDYTVNDTYYDEQWGLDHISIESAWGITRGSTSVRVGIFEDGITSHADINSSRIISGNLQYNTNGVYEHGTSVTGVIGATSNNNVGIAGVAQVSLVILDGSYNNFVSSLAYAANNDIYIINASFHYENSNGTISEYNSVHAAAIQNYPGLIVCAAGNRDANIDVSPQYPAAYNLDNIITVANTDEYDELYIDTDGEEKNYSSNYGATKVHLAAPGTGILTTSATGGYISETGTSMAAPFVTGVAALLKSKYPTMGAKAMKYYIEQGVDVIPELEDKVVTSGRLNAYKTLNGVKTFTIRYNSNGGLGTMADTEVIYYNHTSMRKNTFTKSCYTFAGWYAKRASDNKCFYTNDTITDWYVEGSQPPGYKKYLYSDQQQVFASSSVDGDIVTMTAQWTPNEYTIHFNGNDEAGGTMTDIEAIYGVPFSLTNNTFVRGTDTMTHWYAKKGNFMYYTGAAGAGWYTHGNQPSGYTRKEFSNGCQIYAVTLTDIDPDATITMNAYWEPLIGLLGDVNMDEKITVQDSTLIQNYISQTATLTAYQRHIGDVNFSGSLSVKDSTMIQKYVARTITEFGS